MINSTSTPNFQDLVDSVVEPVKDDHIENDGFVKRAIAVGLIIFGMIVYTLVR